MNDSVMAAARRVDQKTDAAVKSLAVRSLSTEFTRRVAEVSFGKTVAGIEEIELRDRVDAAVREYVIAKNDGSDGRRYLGLMDGMAEISDHAGQITPPQA